MPAGTDTHLLLRAFADELVRCGVTDACTSPGSRCAPLVLALVRDVRLRCHSHVDERCAGFFALGLAKASGRAVAITCTSGTAAANLAPAVTEAWEAGVPLVVLTADRPPELREVGAGQAIDQLRLYGSAVKWFFEVGTHEATPQRARWMRTLACRAVWTALEGRPGPVHLNFPLREPLVPPAELGPDPVPGRPGGRSWLLASAQPAASFDAVGLALSHMLRPKRRGILVAGTDTRHSPRLPEAVRRFAEAIGWPLLADPLHGGRGGPAAVAAYDALLRDGAFRERHRPDVVVRIGDLPTSKPLRRWLAGLDDVEQIAFAPSGVWHDPDGVLSAVLREHPGAVLTALWRGALSGDPPEPWGSSHAIPPADPSWLAGWRAADDRAQAAIDAVLGDALSEPRVARELGRRLGAETTVYVASSMPVRDVETFWPARDDGPRVLANRGANGIDGTVSAAFGAAAVEGAGPVVLLIGDVALAHDIGGLLAARRLGLALTIVLLDNDGGGIFEFLPVSCERDVFEEHVATPHGLDFAHAAALYGCAYVRPDTLADLRDALGAGVGHDGVTLIEVRTDRAENLALHRRLDAAVAEAI